MRSGERGRRVATEPARAATARPPAVERPARPRDRLSRCCSSPSSSRVGAFLVHNTLVNLRRQNIATGFGFLDREAGVRHRRVADPLFAGRHLRPRLSRRPAEHALCRRSRHRAGDDPRHRDGHRAAVQQLARQQAGADLCRDLPQHPAAAAAVLLVGAAARERAGAAPGLGAAAGRLHQQSRHHLSGARGRPGHDWMLLALALCGVVAADCGAGAGRGGARP